MTLLRQRMLEEMQIRNFSQNTQESYLQQVSLFARYFRRSPDGLGPVNIRTYQLYLTNEKKLAAGSIHIATSALRFFYSVTLKRPWDVEDILPMPKKSQILPVILSPDEVRQFLSCIPRRKARTVLTVCYAAGSAALGKISPDVLGKISPRGLPDWAHDLAHKISVYRSMRWHQPARWLSGLIGEGEGESPS